MRNKEEIKNRLERILKDYRAKLEAWNNVQRATKKDGTEFAVFSKNFVNASTNQNSDRTVEHPEMTVYYQCDGYKSDSINMYLYMDTLKDGDPRKEGYQKHWHRMTYRYNVKETFEAIEEHKQRIKERISQYEKQLADLDKYFEEADRLKRQVIEFLKADDLKDTIGANSLGYALRDYIKNFL
jgi:hypothetical protein